MRRPHPVLLPAALCLFTLLLVLGELGPVAFAGGVGLAVLPVPAYLLLALWLDRYEPEPARMLAATFFWGASVAVFLAVMLNSLFGALVEPHLGAWADAATAVLAAPVVEELAKGGALFLVYRRAHDEFDNVTDGVIYAAMVGLGFAMIENVQYYGRALADPATEPWGVFFLRGVASPFAHPLFTAMTGIGLGLGRETVRGHQHRVLAPLAGLGTAVLLHMLWNLSASVGDAFAWTYLLVMVPVFVGTLLLVRRALRREARMIRAHLAHLLDGETLSAEELEALCSVRGRLAASLAAARRDGLAGWRRRSDYHRAVTELAFHRWRVARDGGVIEEETHLVRIRELRGDGAEQRA